MVKIITITESGCIAEASDGYSVNVRDCNIQVSLDWELGC